MIGPCRWKIVQFVYNSQRLTFSVRSNRTIETMEMSVWKLKSADIATMLNDEQNTQKVEKHAKLKCETNRV